MYKVRLTKGRSYTGYGVKVTADKPLAEVKEKETLDALIATGRFVLAETAAPAGNDGAGKGAGDKPVEKMTEKELDAYAAENGIDLAGLTKKADKLAKIQQALADTGDGGEGGENKVDFGENE